MASLLGKKIIRVFPQRTNLTPIDSYSFIGSPGLFIPEHDEIHISVLFTWDIKRSMELKEEWKSITDKLVKIGGCAFGKYNLNFTPGTYVKNGVVFTSRGCPNNCSFCFVPLREGKIRELEIYSGNIIQDNNILACSNNHIMKVFEMLKKQKQIKFSGGLESVRITNKIAENLRGLKIYELWLACDHKNSIKNLKKAVNILKKAGFKRNNLRCYVLIGDDIYENENRLKEVYNIGCLPFAQLYQGEKKIEYSEEFKKLRRAWSRPAIYQSIMRTG